MPQASERPSTDRQLWARCPPGIAWKHPGLPTKVPVPVLVEHPEGAATEPGYVWLAMSAKPLYGRERDLEFTEQPPVWTRTPHISPHTHARVAPGSMSGVLRKLRREKTFRATGALSSVG
jgi:hypothetical protein